MTSFIHTSLDEGVLTVTINRADKKNALTNDMYGAMADAIESANVDTAIRALLFQSEGDLFTSGNDLGDFAQQSTGDAPTVRHVTRFLRNLATTTTPVIAAVQGKAVGVGTTLLLHCDVVVMAEDAQLVTPFVNLALIPEAASTWLMPARIGYVRAYELFALGEPLPAATALAWGLANRVVPNAALRDEASALARRIAAKPRGSLAAMKGLMRDATRIESQMDKETTIFAQRLKSAEAREAFAAFAQKRAPDFSKLG